MPGRPPQGQLASWFNRWRKPLSRWLGSRRRIPAADIDDITQEVFLRLLRFERTEVVSSPQSYLFQVAANVASEWAQKARNRQPHSAEWLDDLTIRDQPSDEAMRAQSHAQIQAALQALPARAREVLRLRYRDGLSNEEVAARLGVHPQTVKRDLLQSYSRLRLELSPELLVMLDHSVEPR